MHRAATSAKLSIRSIPWWSWPKLLGPVVMAASLALPGVPAIAVALSAHVLGDYTLLTPGMCRAIAGGPRGFALCATVHLLVDLTRKFGRNDWLGIAADQLCHIAAIAAAACLRR